MSLLLRSPARLLPLIAAVAVCEAVESLPARGSTPPGDGAAAVRRPAIKWPNDIVLGGDERLAKLAGILVEGRPQQGWAVLGIGVNVAVELGRLPDELQGRAATLGLGTGDVEALLAALLVALGRRLQAEPSEVLEAWSERDALRGRRIEWGTRPASRAPAALPSSGVAAGIDGDGRLVVELDGGGRTALEAGEVHLAAV